MLLVHFGETFTAAQCKGTCDTCLHSQAQAHELRNMTAAAKDVIKARSLLWPATAATCLLGMQQLDAARSA